MYLCDNTMASTIFDRLMHRAHIQEFAGKSYRLMGLASRLADLGLATSRRID